MQLFSRSLWLSFGTYKTLSLSCFSHFLSLFLKIKYHLNGDFNQTLLDSHVSRLLDLNFNVWCAGSESFLCASTQTKLEILLSASLYSVLSFVLFCVKCINFRTTHKLFNTINQKASNGIKAQARVDYAKIKL